MAKAKKLPSGNYRVQAGKTVNGKYITRSFTARTAKEAQYAASYWQVKSAEGSSAPAITLHEAYVRYIEDKQNVLSPSTVRTYRTMSNNSLDDIMSMRIADLTQEVLQRSINIYAATHQPKGVANCAGLLTAVLGMFRPDFHFKLTLPKKKQTDMYIPDDNDIKKLLKAIEGTRLEIPVLLAAFGPLRRGEICALTSEDIHGNIITVSKSLVKGSDNKYSVKQPKTYASYRQVKMPDFVIEKLKGIKGNITDMAPDTITDAFPKVLRKNNLPKFRFHDLRHYAVSSLHAINIPDKYIMQRGGWATDHVMNNVYNHTLKSNTDLFQEEISDHFSHVFKG